MRNGRGAPARRHAPAGGAARPAPRARESGGCRAVRRRPAAPDARQIVGQLRRDVRAGAGPRARVAFGDQLLEGQQRRRAGDAEVRGQRPRRRQARAGRDQAGEDRPPDAGVDLLLQRVARARIDVDRRSAVARVPMCRSPSNRCSAARALKIRVRCTHRFSAADAYRICLDRDRRPVAAANWPDASASNRSYRTARSPTDSLHVTQDLANSSGRTP